MPVQPVGLLGPEASRSLSARSYHSSVAFAWAANSSLGPKLRSSWERLLSVLPSDSAMWASLVLGDTAPAAVPGVMSNWGRR